MSCSAFKNIKHGVFIIYLLIIFNCFDLFFRVVLKNNYINMCNY